MINKSGNLKETVNKTSEFIALVCFKTKLLNCLLPRIINETSFQFPADKCTNIKTIGKPVVHNSRLQQQEACMKDPLEIMGAETIFVMEYYSGNVLEEYENMNKFKAGLIRKKFKLPYSWDGTGAVVYGQHLYYNR